MPRPKPPLAAPRSETPTQAVGRLADSIESIGKELRVIRDVLDEIRDAFEWGLKNDKFRALSPIPQTIHAPLAGIPKKAEPPASPAAPIPAAAPVPSAPAGSSKEAKEGHPRSLFGLEE